MEHLLTLGLFTEHLNRLHMILKPFMLRRVKTEVENELSDKIEVKQIIISVLCCLIMFIFYNIKKSLYFMNNQEN